MSKRPPPSSTVPTDTTRQQVVAAQPELREILGPPPILEGENLAVYDNVHNRVRSAVAPTDVLEEFWVRDVVDLVWESLRLRQLKAKLFAACAHEGLRRVLHSLTDGDEIDRLIDGWIDRDPSAVTRVEKLLAQAGFDRDVITAQTLSIRLDDFERLDRMIMQAEAWRNAVIREIDRHRDVASRRLREAVTETEDIECQEMAVSKTVAK